MCQEDIENRDTFHKSEAELMAMYSVCWRPVYSNEKNSATIHYCNIYMNYTSFILEGFSNTLERPTHAGIADIGHFSTSCSHCNDYRGGCRIVERGSYVQKNHTHKRPRILFVHAPSLLNHTTEIATYVLAHTRYITLDFVLAALSFVIHSLSTWK